MTDWLDRAQREIQDFSGLGTAKTAKTGVSAVTAVPHLKKSGISGVGFVSFGSTLVEGFPEIERDIHLQREIQETSRQATANTAERVLTAVTAVHHPGESGNSRGSNGSNGSTSPTGFGEIEGDILAGRSPLPAAEPGILAEIAHPTLPGVSPEFAARLSAEDLADIAAGPLWWRVTIREPGGRTVEVDAPSGWTLGEWAAYAERYHGPGCVVTPIPGLPKPRRTGQPR